MRNIRSTTTTERAAIWVLALASVASLMVALDMLVVTTALSTIRLHLHASLSQLEWTVNAYTLAVAVLLLPAATLGERYGRRRILAVGLSMFTAASAACALAPDVALLIVARAVQGAGSALVIPTALALLGAAFGPERRAWALGIFSAIIGVAVLGGPVIGGAVTQGVAWQWIFWINIPIGLITIPLVVRKINESRGSKAKLDLPGLTFATGAALGLVWGLVRSDSAGWTSAEVIGALAGGLLLTIAFVSWELRAAEPMLPMRLFRSRALSSGNAAIFFLWGSLSGAVFFTAQFLQIAQRHGPLDAGVRLLPWTATLFVVAPIAGKQIARVGERPLAAVGLALQALGMGWVALTATPTVAYAELAVPLMIAGARVSMAIPAVQNAVLGAVAPADIGKASGTLNMIRQLGGVFGIAILAAVFTATGGYTSPHAFSDGYTTAIALSAAFSLAGSLAGLALPRRPAAGRASAPSTAPAAAPASA